MSFEVLEGGLRIDRDPLKHINILRINAKLIFLRIQFTTIDFCKLRLTEII